MGVVIMRWTLKYLSHVYIWPRSPSSSSTGAYLIMSPAFLHLLATALHSIVGLWKDVDVLLDVQNFTSQLGVLCFIIFVMQTRQLFVQIVSDLSNFELFGKPPRLEMRRETLDRYVKLFVVILYLAVLAFIAWPLVSIQSCWDSNKQFGRNEPCGLLLPMWLPWDQNLFPWKQMTFVWQAYCCVVSYGSAGITALALLETMEYLLVRIQHLKTLIGDVVEQPDPRKRQKLLAKWVQYHVYIYDIANKMSVSYKMSLAIFALFVGVLFGFIGYTLMAGTSTVNTMALFCGWFLSLFVACVGGQRLIDESLSVAAAIYDSKWYDNDVKFQKNISVILMRAQKPILIDAGPFTNLSLLLILTVLQTAYSYINLLSATSD
ncbi:unnamed protein product [Tenebrio molitor]|nr:unnamed protein product [Tenebrio molitor]